MLLPLIFFNLCSEVAARYRRQWPSLLPDSDDGLKTEFELLDFNTCNIQTFLNLVQNNADTICFICYQADSSN